MLFGPLVCTSIWFYSTGHFCDHLPLSLFPHFWVLCILDSMIDVYTWQIIARSFFSCDYLLEIVMVQYVTVKPLGVWSHLPLTRKPAHSPSITAGLLQEWGRCIHPQVKLLSSLRWNLLPLVICNWQWVKQENPAWTLAPPRQEDAEVPEFQKVKGHVSNSKSIGAKSGLSCSFGREVIPWHRRCWFRLSDFPNATLNITYQHSRKGMLVLWEGAERHISTFQTQESWKRKLKVNVTWQKKFDSCTQWGGGTFGTAARAARAARAAKPPTESRT